MHEHRFAIPVESFDASLLPADAGARSSVGFALSAVRHLERGFESIGCQGVVLADNRKITVDVLTEMDFQQFGRTILDAIQAGDERTGFAMLRLWAVERWHNRKVLLALGTGLLEIGCCKEDQGFPASAAMFWKESEFYLRRARFNAPEDVEILEWLVLGLLKLGRINEAVAISDRSSDRTGINAEVRLRCGSLLSEAGSHLAAILHFRAATAIDPQNIEAWLELAVSLENNGSKPESDQAFANALRSIMRSSDAAVFSNDMK
jgi:tetratricopeptide (TPR) repeat protein